MKNIRITAIIILLFVSVNALIAGYLFIIDPSGSKLGIPVSRLKDSPFSDFLIPGIVLFVVIGLFNLIAAIATFLKLKIHPTLITWQGLILMGWIIIQIILLHDLNFLHFFMTGLGAVLFMLGNRLNF